MVYFQERSQNKEDDLSWFNFYIKKKVRYPYYQEDLETLGSAILETYFDKEEYNYWQRWEIKARENRGKLIKFFDDATGEQMTPQQIRELEEKENGQYFISILEDGDTQLVSARVKKSGRKYKPRIPISADLRKAVYEIYDKACHSCGSRHANQIHHMDGDPTNNHIKNLELLCYDCHLTIEGKQKFRAE